MASFELVDTGGSRSIPDDDPLRGLAKAGASVALVLGGTATSVATAVERLDRQSRLAVIVELGTECLGFHTGETSHDATNVVGFARFRIGTQEPSTLVELVRCATTSDAAVAAATAFFSGIGFQVSICSDVPGRIVDNLLRPYLNAALRAVDEGLASPEDLDRALRLGLGYPRGPIELLEQSGIGAHYDVTRDLYDSLGALEYFPARRARIAGIRRSWILHD